MTGVVAALFRADGRHGGRWLGPAPVATVDWTRRATRRSSMQTVVCTDRSRRVRGDAPLAEGRDQTGLHLRTESRLGSRPVSTQYSDRDLTQRIEHPTGTYTPQNVGGGPRLPRRAELRHSQLPKLNSQPFRPIRASWPLLCLASPGWAFCAVFGSCTAAERTGRKGRADPAVLVYFESLTASVARCVVHAGL